jgi:hypothetical protein
MLNQSTP